MIDPEVIAHEFARYFESNYCDSSLNASLKESFHSAYYDVLIAKPENCFGKDFTLSEIKSAISKLKKDKVYGFDMISPEMIIFAGESLHVALMK